MDIDLGSKKFANVKVNGETYKLSLPTVKQTDEFRAKTNAEDSNLSELYFEFLEELGMPRDIVEQLDIHQFQKLSDGLLGMAGKK